MNIVKMEDLNIADLKAAYDFNAMERKDLRKLLKSNGIKDFNANAEYQDLMVIQENLYNALQDRINAIEMTW
ncbi:hypothetical protein [Flavobacterium sp. IB48]|uniref:hypothetical protein n=1 Tax=Flavobacterium sp. IB48 TaxID=2779375 RepID=UPI0018E70FEF|nr:hypothetical protein [Flavobacterium sp. IB48]MBJ2125419.1 hypothetical protein [Flavobacterium sp. IB48]